MYAYIDISLDVSVTKSNLHYNSDWGGIIIHHSKISLIFGGN